MTETDGRRQADRGQLRLKRTYDPAEPSDGLRVLVDRLWPRGLRKAEARIDLWLKEIGPSAELRRWFGHDPARWEAFRRKYREELQNRTDQTHTLQALQEALSQGPVTLLFSAQDRERNNAVVLKDMLDSVRRRS